MFNIKKKFRKSLNAFDDDDDDDFMIPEWNDNIDDMNDFGLSSLSSKPQSSSPNDNNENNKQRNNDTNEVKSYNMDVISSPSPSNSIQNTSNESKISNHSSTQRVTNIISNEIRMSRQMSSGTIHLNSSIDSKSVSIHQNSESTNHVSDTQENIQFSNSFIHDNNGDDDDENLTESQSNVRKIPGPAGALPPLKQGEKIRNDHEIIDNENKYQDPTLVLGISSQFIRTSEKKMKKVIEDEVDFRQPSWASMLMDMDLPPFGHSKLNYSLWWVHEIGYRKKVPQLIVLVKSLKTEGEDYQCTLRDPTGEYDYNTIHKGTIEMYPDITQGCVFELKNVPVFTPRNNNHYLIITPKNINKVWPKNINVPYENLKKLDPRKNDLTSIYDDSCLKKHDE